MTKSITSVIRVLFLRGLGVLISLGTAVGIAFHFGAGPLTDAFFLVRRLFGSLNLLIEDLTSMILVPGFVRAAQTMDAASYVASQKRRERMLFLGGAIVALGAIVLAPQIINWTAPGLSPDAVEQARVFFILMALTLPITFSAAFTGAGLMAIRQFSMPVALRLAPRVLILLAVLLVPLGMGMNGIVMAAVLGHVIMLMALWWVRRRIARLSRESKARTAPSEVPHGGTSVRAYAGIIMAIYFLIVVISESYAASLVGVGALAILALGQRISTLGVSEMLSSVMAIYYTNFSEKAGDKEALNAEVGNALLTGYFFTAPLTLCIAVLAPSIAQLILANGAFSSMAAAQAGELVAWFAIAALLNTGVSVFQTVILTRAKKATVLHFAQACVAALVVRFGVLIALLPSFELNALGVAAVVGPIALMAVHYLYILRDIGQVMRRPVVVDLTKVMACAVCAAAIGGGVQAFWPGDAGKIGQTVMLGVAVSLSAIVYLALAKTLGLSDADDILSGVAKKLRR